MDFSNNYSDPFQIGSILNWSPEILSTVSPVSDSGSGCMRANFSDEEVMLASSHPKKAGWEEEI
jgi:hypothetical protein